MRKESSASGKGSLISKSAENGEKSIASPSADLGLESTNFANVTRETESNLIDLAPQQSISGESTSGKLEATIPPDLLLSLTSQTPLNLPTDNSEILNNTEEILGSSTTSSLIIDSTTIPGQRKDGKETINDNQEKAESTAVSTENTDVSISASEDEENDIIGLAANIFETISSKGTASDMPEESLTGSKDVASLVTPETSTITSQGELTLTSNDALHKNVPSSTAEVTVSTAEETASTAEVSAPTESDADVTPRKTDSDVTITAMSKSVTSASNGTKIRTSGERNIKVTSENLKPTSERWNNSHQVSFTKSIPKSITQEPFLEDNLDKIIKNVVQSQNIFASDDTPVITQSTVKKKTLGKMREGGRGSTSKISSDITTTSVSG